MYLSPLSYAQRRRIEFFFLLFKRMWNEFNYSTLIFEFKNFPRDFHALRNFPFIFYSFFKTKKKIWQLLSKLMDYICRWAAHLNSFSNKIINHKARVIMILMWFNLIWFDLKGWTFSLRNHCIWRNHLHTYQASQSNICSLTKRWKVKRIWKATHAFYINYPWC